MYKRLLLAFAVYLLVAGCKKNDPQNQAPQVTPVQGTIKADWGDTISVSGKNLPADTKVYFGTDESGALQSYVISNNGETIRCVVPAFGGTNPTVSVFVQYNGQTTTLTNYVTLNAPLISSFTRTQAIGDTVIINGDHFNTYNLGVSFGGASTSVTLVSKKMIRAVVPNEIKHVKTTISVTSQLQTTASIDTFTILKPVITSITPSALIGSKVTITGKYFHPGAPFLVYLDGVQVPGAAESNTQITFTLPYKTYPQRKTTVSLQLLEYEITYQPDLMIKDNWIMVSQGIPFVAYNVTPLNVGSSVYVVAPEKPAGSQNIYLWRFNQADYSWTKVGAQITIITSGYCVGTDGTHIYLYNVAGPANFYECDPSNGVWTAKSNFTGQQRNGAAMFSIGGKIYLGAGSYYLGNNLTGLNDWYAYTPGSDTWTRIADMRSGTGDGYLVQLAQSMVINNTAYVVCGGWFDDYKYNASSNTWAPMQLMLQPRTQVGVLTYNNKIYTLKGYVVQNVGNSNRDIFSYDPSTDQWQYDPGDVDPYDDELTIAFTVGNKIYMLSYDNSAFQNNLYEALTLP